MGLLFLCCVENSGHVLPKEWRKKANKSGTKALRRFHYCVPLQAAPPPPRQAVCPAISSPGIVKVKVPTRSPLTHPHFMLVDRADEYNGGSGSSQCSIFV